MEEKWLKRPRSMGSLLPPNYVSDGGKFDLGLPRIRPAWLLNESIESLDSKFPMVPAPSGAIVLYTTPLGVKLRQQPRNREFDLTDPLRPSLSYNYLHDEHLKVYFRSSDIRKRLTDEGFITDDGYVKCSLKEFNEYRQWIRNLKLDELHRERRLGAKQMEEAKKERLERMALERDPELLELMRKRRERRHDEAKLRQKRIKREQDRQRKLDEMDRRRREEFLGARRMTRDRMQIKRDLEREKKKKAKHDKERKDCKIRLRIVTNMDKMCDQRMKNLQEKKEEAREIKKKKLEEQWYRRQSWSIEHHEEQRLLRELQEREFHRQVEERSSKVARQRRWSQVSFDEIASANRRVFEKKAEKAEMFLARLKDIKTRELLKWKKKFDGMTTSSFSSVSHVPSSHSSVSKTCKKRSRRQSAWDLESCLLKGLGMKESEIGESTYSKLGVISRAQETMKDFEYLADRDGLGSLREVEEDYEPAVDKEPRFSIPVIKESFCSIREISDSEYSESSESRSTLTSPAEFTSDSLLETKLSVISSQPRKPNDDLSEEELRDSVEKYVQEILRRSAEVLGIEIRLPRQGAVAEIAAIDNEKVTTDSVAQVESRKLVTRAKVKEYLSGILDKAEEELGVTIKRPPEYQKIKAEQTGMEQKEIAVSETLVSRGIHSKKDCPSRRVMARKLVCDIVQSAANQEGVAVKFPPQYQSSIHQRSAADLSSVMSAFGAAHHRDVLGAISFGEIALASRAKKKGGSKQTITSGREFENEAEYQKISEELLRRENLLLMATRVVFTAMNDAILIVRAQRRCSDFFMGGIPKLELEFPIHSVQPSRVEKTARSKEERSRRLKEAQETVEKEYIPREVDFLSKSKKSHRSGRRSARNRRVKSGAEKKSSERQIAKNEKKPGQRTAVVKMHGERASTAKSEKESGKTKVDKVVKTTGERVGDGTDEDSGSQDKTEEDFGERERNTELETPDGVGERSEARPPTVVSGKSGKSGKTEDHVEETAEAENRKTSGENIGDKFSEDDVEKLVQVKGTVEVGQQSGKKSRDNITAPETNFGYDQEVAAKPPTSQHIGRDNGVSSGCLDTPCDGEATSVDRTGRKSSKDMVQGTSASELKSPSLPQITPDVSGFGLENSVRSGAVTPGRETASSPEIRSAGSPSSAIFRMIGMRERHESSELSPQSSYVVLPKLSASESSFIAGKMEDLLADRIPEHSYRDLLPALSSTSSHDPDLPRSPTPERQAQPVTLPKVSSVEVCPARSPTPARCSSQSSQVPLPQIGGSNTSLVGSTENLTHTKSQEPRKQETTQLSSSNAPEFSEDVHVQDSAETSVKNESMASPNNGKQKSEIGTRKSEIATQESTNATRKVQNKSKKSQNTSQGSDDGSQKSQNSSKKSENLSTKSENLNIKSENLQRKNENLGTKSENLNTKSENLKKKSQNLETKSENLNSRSEQLKKKSENFGTKSENLNTKSDNFKKKSENLGTQSENLIKKSENLKVKSENLITKTANKSDMHSETGNLKTRSENVIKKSEKLKSKSEHLDRKVGEANEKSENPKQSLSNPKQKSKNPNEKSQNQDDKLENSKMESENMDLKLDSQHQKGKQVSRTKSELPRIPGQGGAPGSKRKKSVSHSTTAIVSKRRPSAQIEAKSSEIKSELETTVRRSSIAKNRRASVSKSMTGDVIVSGSKTSLGSTTRVTKPHQRRASRTTAAKPSVTKRASEEAVETTEDDKNTSLGQNTADTITRRGDSANVVHTEKNVETKGSLHSGRSKDRKVSGPRLETSAQRSCGNPANVALTTAAADVSSTITSRSFVGTRTTDSVPQPLSSVSERVFSKQRDTTSFSLDVEKESLTGVEIDPKMMAEYVQDVGGDISKLADLHPKTADDGLVEDSREDSKIVRERKGKAEKNQAKSFEGSKTNDRLKMVEETQTTEVDEETQGGKSKTGSKTTDSVFSRKLEQEAKTVRPTSKEPSYNKEPKTLKSRRNSKVNSVTKPGTFSKSVKEDNQEVSERARHAPKRSTASGTKLQESSQGSRNPATIVTKRTSEKEVRRKRTGSVTETAQGGTPPSKSKVATSIVDSVEVHEAIRQSVEKTLGKRDDAALASSEKARSERKDKRSKQIFATPAEVADDKKKQAPLGDIPPKGKSAEKRSRSPEVGAPEHGEVVESEKVGASQRETDGGTYRKDKHVDKSRDQSFLNSPDSLASTAQETRSSADPATRVEVKGDGRTVDQLTDEPQDALVENSPYSLEQSPRKPREGKSGNARVTPKDDNHETRFDDSPSSDTPDRAESDAEVVVQVHVPEIESPCSVSSPVGGSDKDQASVETGSEDAGDGVKPQNEVSTVDVIGSDAENLKKGASEGIGKEATKTSHLPLLKDKDGDIKRSSSRRTFGDNPKEKNLVNIIPRNSLDMLRVTKISPLQPDDVISSRPLLHHSRSHQLPSKATPPHTPPGPKTQGSRIYRRKSLEGKHGKPVSNFELAAEGVGLSVSGHGTKPHPSMHRLSSKLSTNLEKVDEAAAGLETSSSDEQSREVTPGLSPPTVGNDALSEALSITRATVVSKSLNTTSTVDKENSEKRKDGSGNPTEVPENPKQMTENKSDVLSSKVPVKPAQPSTKTSTSCIMSGSFADVVQGTQLLKESKKEEMARDVPARSSRAGLGSDSSQAFVPTPPVTSKPGVVSPKVSRIKQNLSSTSSGKSRRSLGSNDMSPTASLEIVKLSSQASHGWVSSPTSSVKFLPPIDARASKASDHSDESAKRRPRTTESVLSRPGSAGSRSSANSKKATVIEIRRSSSGGLRVDGKKSSLIGMKSSSSGGSTKQAVVGF